MKNKKKVFRRVFALLCSVIIIANVCVTTASAYNPNDYADSILQYPSNKTDGYVFVEQDIYFSLWRDGYNKLLYETCFVENVPGKTSWEDVDSRTAMPRQWGAEFVGYYEHTKEGFTLENGVEKYTTLYYYKYFRDIDGTINVYYDPSTNQYYDSIRVAVSFENMGDIPDVPIENIRRAKTYHYEVPHEAEYSEALGQHSLESFSLTISGEYRLYLTILYYRNGDLLPLQYQTVQDLHVMNYDKTIHQITEGYFNDGYNKGFSDGCASMEKWDFYSLISAIFTAPLTFLSGALNFEVFGINMWNTVQFIFTALLILFVVVVILRLVT